MPSVGMRRSTRVFGTRVLRSGRKVSRGPTEGGKCTGTVNRHHEWIELVDNSGGGRGVTGSPCKRDALGEDEDENENESDPTMERVEESKLTRDGENRGAGVERATNEDKMYGIAYSRKRKKVEVEITDVTEDVKFGKKFERRKWRKKQKTCRELRVYTRCRKLSVLVAEGSGDSCNLIACLLNSTLRYLRKVKLGLRSLFELVFSEPIFHAFSSAGIRFLKDHTSSRKPGFCLIWESRSLIPVFTVDYSAVPLCFMNLHSRMLLRSACLACIFGVQSFGAYEKVKKVIDCEKEHTSNIPSVAIQSDCNMLTSKVDNSERSELSHLTVDDSNIDNSERRELLHLPVGFSKSAVRNNPLRSGHGIQKRRTTLRRGRGRPPSAFRAQRGIHDVFQSSATPTGRLLRSSIKWSSNINVKNPKSSLVGSTQEDINANSCSANILVVENDKGYREEGAIIALQVSSSKHQFLAVKKDGVQRYSFTAQKVMRPSSVNKVTHATIWSGDGNWKLEFPCKRDWLIFKELYKKCYDHNVQVPTNSVIPVPGVREVSDPAYTDTPYTRPQSYITVREGELSRALRKRIANYEMDSEDEEWLKKFNSEPNSENEVHQFVTFERFESIMDKLERGFHGNPDDWSDETLVDSVGLELERKELVEAVLSYWNEKRRRKVTALARIFKAYEPKTPVIPKSILRKKRSFKRQGTLTGRGKQLPLLQAKAVEQDISEQQKNFVKAQEAKVEEAKAAANRFEGLAILKRQRAQELLENADLATYRALMALRIAETAQESESQSDTEKLVFSDSS